MGWIINQRGLFFGRQRLRLLHLACKKFDLVRWYLNHAAKLGNGQGPDSDHPPVLQSVAERGSVNIYKLLQRFGPRLGPRDLRLGARRDGINCYEMHWGCFDISLMG
jgi:hypothetical protein